MGGGPSVDSSGEGGGQDPACLMGRVADAAGSRATLRSKRKLTRYRQQIGMGIVVAAEDPGTVSSWFEE
jgi:hypothetical protein